MYPSNVEDWEPLECIIGTLEVNHSFIGEQIYKGRKGKSLAENGIFFYDHKYKVPRRGNTLGELEFSPLPDFYSPEWTSPSQGTIESYRNKIFSELQRCQKSNIACKQCRVSLFMPPEVFVHLMKDKEVHRARTMFSVKAGQEHTTLEFLHAGWDEKIENDVHCRIHKDTISIKYMICSQNFIFSFYYSRWHKVRGVVLPLDQVEENMVDNQIIDVEVYFENVLHAVVNLREKSTLHQLRQDLKTEGEDLPEEFCFTIVNKKVKAQHLDIVIFYVYSNMQIMHRYQREGKFFYYAKTLR